MAGVGLCSREKQLMIEWPGVVAHCRSDTGAEYWSHSTVLVLWSLTMDAGIQPGRGYDVDTLADDIAAVIDSRDLQSVVIVGHSMGGAEVVRYLTRHRSRRVTRAVLIAPSTPFALKTEDNPDGTPREALAKTREGLARDCHHVVAQAAPAFFGAKTTPTLIVHGDQDVSARLDFNGRRTHELIPGSRFLIDEGAAHGLPFTHTDRLLTDIIGFAG
jgi:non-heme chloroperoxidase